jgi:hypothetical protein
MGDMNDQSDKASILVRMTADRRARIQEVAAASGMSVNSYLLKAVDMVAHLGPIMTVERNASEPGAVPESENAQYRMAPEGDQNQEGMRLFHESPNDVKLEELKNHRIYDTQFHLNPYQWPQGMMKKLLAADPPPLSFFRTPHIAGGPAFTNMGTAGCMFWPKRFTVEHIELTADRQLPREMVRELSLRFIVGEKEYGAGALTALPAIEGLANSWLLKTDRVWIPSVQNFQVDLLTGGLWLGEVEWRCSLYGSLYREIE